MDLPADDMLSGVTIKPGDGQVVIKNPADGAAAIAVLTAGQSVASAAKAFAIMPYNVTFNLKLSNFTNQYLYTHEAFNDAGHISEAPQPVAPGKVEGLAGHKSSGSATGCAGTVAWKIGNTGKMVVVMYSVPYSHDFHSNWCGAGIFDVGSTNHLFDIMYYKNRTDFTRKEFWSDLGPLIYDGDSTYSVYATMGNSHKSTVEVSLIPKSVKNLASQLQGEGLANQ